ncbi:MAG: 4'-phosphopantetheinyl transferase superfamily protein [Candidatus Acidiferrum sp.]
MGVNLFVMNSTAKPVTWIHPPSVPNLPLDELHIWLASLDIDRALRDHLGTFLSPDECVRAERFVFERDREHFIAARGTLREILSRYLAVQPESIRLQTTKHGKPFLDTKSGGPRLRFNLAHSHGLALYAVAQYRELGVDIERIDAERATSDIAERYFSLAERAELASLPEHLRLEAFFLCWTRKEAYVKARGEGLHIPLDSFDVSLTPGQPALLSSEDSSQWSLTVFSPAPGFAAACISEAGADNPKFWDFSSSFGPSP